MHVAIIMTVLMWTGIETTEVSPDKVKETVSEFILQKLGPASEATVEFRSRLPRIAIRSTDYTVRVAQEILPNLKGYVSIPVEVVAGKRVEGRAVISAYVRTFENVAVTVRQLQKHESLNPDDISFKKIETTTLGKDVILAPSEIVNTRATRIITANSLLRHAMIERIPIMKQDSRVLVVVRSKNAVITTDGIVRDDGALGDVVTVQRMGTHERLQGRVVDAHTVEILVDEFTRLLQGAR